MVELNRTHPTRRFRLDASATGPSALPRGGRGTSGRTVVIAIAAAVVLLWGALTLAMGRWKADYLAKAEYGRSQVATVVDRFARLAPPDVPAEPWARAVADTHQMLVALTASGLLDRPAMDGLRAELEARVDRSKPETALAELSGLWDEIEAKAGPVVAPSGPIPGSSRHAGRVQRPARPALLGPTADPDRRPGASHPDPL
ncbi:hypothetical protein EP7_000034 [Isosphaeraceae bacterium EP7]